jgi:hypothetical protein
MSSASVASGWGGLTTVSRLSDSGWSSASAPPKLTLCTPVIPLPVTVTRVPPERGPPLGTRPATTGLSPGPSRATKPCTPPPGSAPLPPVVLGRSGEPVSPVT